MGVREVSRHIHAAISRNAMEEIMAAKKKAAKKKVAKKTAKKKTAKKK